MSSVLTKSVIAFTCVLLLASLLVLFFAFHESYQADDQSQLIEETLDTSMAEPFVEFRHHNNSEVNTLLVKYAEYYSKLARHYSIGHSVRNKSILALEISDNPGIHEPGEPELKLVGNIHGNEVVGRELLLYLIEYLLKNYQTDDIVRQLVDNVRLHIVPTINPDGYEDAQEGDCDGVKGRENAHEIDLNRNFPDQFLLNLEQPLEPETQNVINWTLSYPFVLSAALHGGALVVNYPYDNNERSLNRYTKSPDDQIFRHIALLYSQNNPDMKEGKCADQCSTDFVDHFPQGITNGAAWYPISGGMQDWNYVQANCFEITIELGCRKYPPSDQLDKYWKANIDSIIRLINSVHLGIWGFVFDQLGRPLEGAIVSIAGINKNVSSYKAGDYWRLLTPNAHYTVTVWKQGYIPQSESLYIEQSYQLNFTLHPSLSIPNPLS